MPLYFLFKIIPDKIWTKNEILSAKKNTAGFVFFTHYLETASLINFPCKSSQDMRF